MSSNPRRNRGKGSQRYAHCSCKHRIGGRNLVVNLDGTGNQFGERNTNVIELYYLVAKNTSDNQLCWYNSGIGTYARPSWTSFSYFKKVLFHKIDLAIAWEFERTVMGAYRWLSDNYQDGDCIFIFGFSRGAFQARVLSAMIDKVGLIHKGNEMQIPFAYELYADPKSGDALVNQTGSSEKISMAARFKSAFCHEDVKVHFVGAWDTVSSIGIMRGQHMLPGTIDGMKHVCYFRHALALDERRVKFLPEYAYGGSSEPPEDDSDSANDTVYGPSLVSLPLYDLFLVMNLFHFFGLNFLVKFLAFLFKEYLGIPTNTPRPDRRARYDTAPSRPSQPPIIPISDSKEARLRAVKPWVAGTHSDIPETNQRRPHTLEVWFAGTHSDIGGGNVQNVGMDRSRPPLRWMALEAVALGLRLKLTFSRELSSNEQIDVKESLTLGWKFLEWIPIKRLTFASRNTHQRETYWPHFGAARVIQPGQKLHSSLILSGGLGTTYIPKALLPDQTNDQADFWQQLNTSESLSHWLLMDLDTHVEDIIRIYILEETKRETMFNILRQIATWNDGRQAVYETTVNAFESGSLGKMCLQDVHYAALGEINTRLNLHGEICESVGQYLHGYLARNTQEILTSLDRIATWDDGRRAIYEVSINAVKLGTLITLPLSIELQIDLVGVIMEHVPQPLHLRDELCSTMDDILKGFFRKVSGSLDILKKSLSNDRRQVLYDVWINLLKSAKIGDELRTPEHCHGIMQSVIRVLEDKSGLDLVHPKEIHNALTTVLLRKNLSDMRGYFLANYTTFCQLRIPGHSGTILSVVFSPDGKKLVSGSVDCKIRIWDADTGAQIGDPLTGHTDLVWSVAVSPDGKYIVSGSEDHTVRLWDMEARTKVGDLWKGHTKYVYSIAFSPDGRHVVSGSNDRTVRLWDVESGTQMGDPWTGHQDFVWCVAYSPDGSLVASASPDWTVRIWDATTHQQINAPLEHVSAVLSVSFSPDGKQIASGMYDGQISLWDVETHQQIGRPFSGHTSWVRSVCFSPDGKLLVSGSDDNTVRIWDVETGGQVGKPLRGHNHCVRCIAFSPDGRNVASASEDSTIRIWDIKDYVVWGKL